MIAVPLHSFFWLSFAKSCSYPFWLLRSALCQFVILIVFILHLFLTPPLFFSLENIGVGGLHPNMFSLKNEFDFVELNTSNNIFRLYLNYELKCKDYIICNT